MSPHVSWFVVVAAAFPLVMSAVSPGSAASDPLAAHRWKDRVLLVITDSADDARLRDQREIVQTMGDAARERDLTLLVVMAGSTEGTTLRQRFGLGPGFHALLIGKDGGAKLAAETPLRAEALVPLIDAMPMRQDEVRRRS